MNSIQFDSEKTKMVDMTLGSLPLTREDGEALENRLRSEMLEIKTTLRLQMGEMKSELRQEMAEMKSELRQEMAEMKSELRQEMGEMKSELRQEMIQPESRWMRYIHDQGWKMMGLQVATPGLMLSAFKFLH